MIDDEAYLMGEDEFEPEDEAPRRRRRRLQAHRGTSILVYGILGLVCCFIFGIAAWVMGAEDLKKMDQGLMDPAGRGTTQAGKILGIISVVIAVLYLVFGAATGFQTNSLR